MNSHTKFAVTVLLLSLTVAQCQLDFARQLEYQNYEFDGDDFKSIVPGQVRADQSAELPPIPDEWSPKNEYNLIRVFRGLYYNKIYGEINDVLVDNVKTNSTKENMDFALNWLARETKDGVSVFKRPLVEALKQFTALATISEQNRCNRNTYEILFKNNKAVEDKAHKRPSKVGHFRRIEALIHAFNLQHAIACLPLYPQNLERLYDTLNREYLDRVGQFQTAIVENRRKSCAFLEMCKLTSQKSNLEIALSVVSFKGDAPVAYKAIKTFAANDPDRKYLDGVLDEKRGKMVIVESKVRELFTRYLVDPCEYFVRSLGPEVFIPARYDAAVIESEDLAELSSHDYDSYKAGFASFRLCQKLIKSQESLADDLISHAKKLKN